MRKELLYCDLCNKQVENYSDLENLEFNPKPGNGRKLEICKDCFYKIRDYAFSLKVKEE